VAGLSLLRFDPLGLHRLRRSPAPDVPEPEEQAERAA